MPPANSIDALTAIAGQEEATLRHIRQCPACRVAWYRSGGFRAGCTNPRSGAAVMMSIGRLPPEAARAHIAVCLACRLLVLDAARTVMAGDTDV